MFLKLPVTQTVNISMGSCDTSCEYIYDSLLHWLIMFLQVPVTPVADVFKNLCATYMYIHVHSSRFYGFH